MFFALPQTSVRYLRTTLYQCNDVSNRPFLSRRIVADGHGGDCSHMPRKSPFSIVLSKQERSALEGQVRRYTSSYCDVIRAKIVLPCRRRPRERRHRRSFGHSAPDRPQMAQAICSRAPSGPRGATPGRNTRPVLLRASSFNLMLSPANFSPLDSRSHESRELGSW